MVDEAQVAALVNEGRHDEAAKLCAEHGPHARVAEMHRSCGFRLT